jgi:hypothetical protein
MSFTTAAVTSTMGIGVGVDTVQTMKIEFTFDDDGFLEGIQASTQVGVNTPVVTPLLASAVANTWYNVAMKCDGTTGITYYLSDDEGALIATADETDLPVPSGGFDTWGVSYYDVSVSSGLFIGTGAMAGDIDSFRVDWFSFFTE